MAFLLPSIGNLSGSDRIIKLIDEFTGDLDSIQREERDKKISELKAKAFKGLNERWWKQIIDGSDHDEGPLIYDNQNEPGYLKGIKSGYDFASAHLEEPLSTKLYKDLHRFSLCPSVNDKMPNGIAGKFFPARGSMGYPSFLFYEDLKTQEEVGKEIEEFENYKTIYNAHKFFPDSIHLAREIMPNSSDDEIRSKIAQAKEWLVKRQEEVKSRVDLMNQYITARSRRLGLAKPLARFFFCEKNEQGEVVESQEEFPEKLSLECCFFGSSEKEMESIVKKMFSDYEQNMKKARTPEKKLEYIAALYQNLNWLHPFYDGQGRTTFILLGKELCRHGFNPAILDMPYFANFSFLSNWISYLKEGIIEWQKEFVNPHRNS